MNREVYNVTVGALLHDIGKVLHRAGKIDARSHSISGYDFLKTFTNSQDILNCVRYHHKQEISGAKIANDSLAYIVYIADNISSGLDRRDIEGEDSASKKFEKNLPLASIYNLLNQNSGKQSHLPKTIDAKKEINYPADQNSIINLEHLYNNIYQELKQGLLGIDFEPEYLNSIMEIAEACLTYVPSSTMQSQVSDISLFDHQKTTAALASCIYQYLATQNRSDFKKELLNNEKSFCQEKAFLMMSCDISGIQQFIYTISSKGAMKGLRARSFYLEILLENIVDEILAKCGLSRANLIYTGGGHAYMLLPNTDEVMDIVEFARKTINRWLIKNFGNALYLAFATQECSATELMNQTDDPEAYQNIYRSLSAKLSQIKLRRYDSDEIRMLNSSSGKSSDGRECRVCGTVNELIESNGESICEACHSLQEISRELIQDDFVFAVTRQRWKNKPSLHLPSLSDSPCFLYALSDGEVKELLKNNSGSIDRVYGKNKMMTGLKLAAKIWMGDYTARDSDGIADFESLSKGSEGVERIAVLRADVDNLGAAFVSGFIRADDRSNKYVTLSRSATLSRSLSIFFKYYINEIIKGHIGEDIPVFRLSKGEIVDLKNITIVYAGGDDVFVVGAWNEVIEAAVNLKNAFAKFSGGTLTISAGIGIYSPTYPISRMAIETEKLEKAAKNQPQKNSISFFGEEIWNNQLQARHTYSWDEFISEVTEQKLRLLQAHFSKNGANTENSTHGSSLLYRLMNLIRDIEENGERINIARFAYILGRLEPDSKDEEGRQKYKDFTNKMYSWILNENDRKQLLTAMIIHTYLLRKKGE